MSADAPATPGGSENEASGTSAPPSPPTTVATVKATATPRTSAGPGAPAPSPSSPSPGGGRRALLSRRVGWTVAAVVALAIAVVLSLAVGARAVPPMTAVDALLHGGHSNDAEVVRQLRVPRTVIGLLVGAALALAGTTLQGITRNPIADPGILGISQGSSVGVVLAITFAGVHTLNGYVWFAFAGAGAASVAVYAIASRGRGGATPVKLALGGAAINALLVAITQGILTTNAATLEEFRFWQVGSLTGREGSIAGEVWPFLLVGTVLVVYVARGLDALALGDDVAVGLGQNVAVVRIVGGLGATLLVGGGVAAAGPIAFVGLAVPHIARALVGTDHRWVLPMAALIGPVMLLVSDVIGRIIFPPSEVPAGVMTALIGVPFLVALVRRKAVSA